jgi:hypothetical protein
MVKRSREPSVEFSVINNKVIANCNGNQYICKIPIEQLNTIVNDSTYDYDIIGKSKLKIENLRINTDVSIHKLSILK